MGLLGRLACSAGGSAPRGALPRRVPSLWLRHERGCHSGGHRCLTSTPGSWRRSTRPRSPLPATARPPSLSSSATSACKTGWPSGSNGWLRTSPLTRTATPSTVTRTTLHDWPLSSSATSACKTGWPSGSNGWLRTAPLTGTATASTVTRTTLDDWPTPSSGASREPPLRRRRVRGLRAALRRAHRQLALRHGGLAVADPPRACRVRRLHDARRRGDGRRRRAVEARAVKLLRLAVAAALMAAATIVYALRHREREYAWPCPPEDADGIVGWDPRTASTGLADVRRAG